MLTPLPFIVYLLHSATSLFSQRYMKYENDVSNVLDCLQIVRIQSTRFVYRLSLYFPYKRIKTCCPCLHSLLKTSVKFVRILEQVKTLYCASRVFTDLLSISPKRSPRDRFSQGYECTENMFYFLNNSRSLPKRYSITVAFV